MSSEKNDSTQPPIDPKASPPPPPTAVSDADRFPLPETAAADRRERVSPPPADVRLPRVRRPPSAPPRGTLTPLYNPFHMTTLAAHEQFLARNKVSPTYRGPVHVVEEMHVLCAECGGPVDPVTRVPAGKLFFHPNCIRCYLCQRAGVTEAFFQATGPFPICAACAARGFARCVPREATERRGIVLGAVRGGLVDALRAFDTAHGRRVNSATVDGAIPPTLTLAPVHNRRNSTQRSLALMQRQQYYTQNDNNILALSPPSPSQEASGAAAPRPGTGRRKLMYSK